MRLMRDDEYEPLRLNHEYPPIAEKRINRPRFYKRKPQEGPAVQRVASERAASNARRGTPPAGVETGRGLKELR